MTTSSSTNFTLTRDEIIQEALEQIGAIGIGDTISATDITTCSRTLNMMIKAWEAKGIHLWTLTEMSVALVVAQATYTLSPRPLMVKQAFLRNTDNIDRPVRVRSKSDYNLIPDKTTTGKISQVCYDPQLSTGTLSVWPTPDDATDVLHLVYLRVIEDFDASSDNADLPQEWLLPIALNLGMLVSPKYGKRPDPAFAQTAAEYLTEMQLWDVENAKIRVVPATDYSV